MNHEEHDEHEDEMGIKAENGKDQYINNSAGLCGLCASAIHSDINAETRSTHSGAEEEYSLRVLRVLRGDELN